MAKRVAIFGSCVTRDIFNGATPDLELVSYHARISPVSLMSAPLNLAPADLPRADGFVARMILADFNKTVLAEIRAARPEIVIFDFAEKYDLLQQNASFATLSNDLKASGFDFAARYRFEVINALSARAASLWKAATKELAARLQIMLPGVQFVLHKAQWVEHFMDGVAVVQFDAATRREATMFNLVLASYYEHFARQFAQLAVIEVAAPVYAARDHKWGLSPLHYHEGYYHAALMQLQQIATAC